MSNHTPGPWAQHKKNGRKVMAGDVVVAIAATQPNAPEAWSNAAFIVRAVNSHADLLAACRSTVVNLEDFIDENGEYQWSVEGGRGIVKSLRAAIARAECT